MRSLNCRLHLWIMAVCLFSWLHPLAAEDWPTFRHDQRRSGATAEQLDARRLDLSWRWQSPLPPAPCWPDAARWDAYAQLAGLRSMRDYDPVFHPVVAQGKLIFASNSDDTVRCFSLRTGQPLWHVTADAPVRVAPTIDSGRVLFGADDGSVYCLALDSGRMLWKTSLAQDPLLFINDGRLCSSQPVRTGILIDDRNGNILVGSGIFPWQQSYLYALEGSSGDKKWTSELGTGWTIEGPMLLSDQHIISPQGRAPPHLFKRDEGLPVGPLSGGGGSFAVLTDEGDVLHGPGNKGGWITASNAQTREKFASFENGIAVVVNGGISFVLDTSGISAFDSAQNQMLWRVALAGAQEIVLGGQTLFVGGDQYVAALDAASGDLQWAKSVNGRAFGLAIAEQRLVASTDLGEIAVFFEQEKERKQIPEQLVKRLRYAADTGEGLAKQDPTEMPLDLSSILQSKQNDQLKIVGPELQFVSTGTAIVSWQAPDDANYRLEIVEGEAQAAPAAQDQQLGSGEHRWTISGVDGYELVRYRILREEGGQSLHSRIYLCDGHFDYTRPPLPASDPSAMPTAAKELTDQLDFVQHRGLAMVIGFPDAAGLAESIARECGMDVIVLAEDQAQVDLLREILISCGIYGRPVAVRKLDVLDSIPSGVMNLVLVNESSLGGSWQVLQETAVLEAIERCTKPLGRLVASEDIAGRMNLSALGYGPRAISDIDELKIAEFRCWTKPRLAGSAAWTHMYGTPANTAYAGESLGGAREIGQLRVAWAGRPGPRYQSDRGNRKPSPLAASGRLFLQGQQRLIGMDAHNGTILWAWELPQMVRFNVPRDSSNWCADQDYLYVAVANTCKKIDGATGEQTAEYPVVNPTDRDLEWGYVARHGQLLLGSGVVAGSAFTDYWGKDSWYDAQEGENAHKVCSDVLFACDANTGQREWTYQSGLVVNPTISIGADSIIFVECRSKALLAGATRRLGGTEFWDDLYVVALDIASGQKRWEVQARPLPGTAAMYGVSTDDTFLLQTSGSGSFALYALDLASGDIRWRGKYEWEANHHGKHLSRPAVVDDKIYLRPLTLELASGKVLNDKFPEGHQCGTYTCSSNALFLRAGNLTMWDGSSQIATRWDRVRPDCWISTIPAEGMLLSPEGGGGCSCGGWIETSIGFEPWREQ